MWFIGSEFSEEWCGREINLPESGSELDTGSVPVGCSGMNCNSTPRVCVCVYTPLSHTVFTGDAAFHSSKRCVGASPETPWALWMSAGFMTLQRSPARLRIDLSVRNVGCIFYLQTEQYRNKWGYIFWIELPCNVKWMWSQIVLSQEKICQKARTPKILNGFIQSQKNGDFSGFQCCVGKRMLLAA